MLDKKVKQMWSIDELQKTWELASKLHDGQKYGGLNEGQQIEYLNHIGSVTFEIINAINNEKGMDADFAINCAVLHDTIEDTEQSFDEIQLLFGERVAMGVFALTKDEKIENKREMMLDSLNRIKSQPKEVWAVKMADRICNLYAPPYYWTNEKKIKYQKEAHLILQELKDGNKYLAERLKNKIIAYAKYFD